MVDFPDLPHEGRTLPSQQLARLAREIADLEGDLGNLHKRGKVADELVGVLRRRIAELVKSMRESREVIVATVSYLRTLTTNGANAEVFDQIAALDEKAELLEVEIKTAGKVTIAGTPFQ